MTETLKYINKLINLKDGELGLLRTHSGQGLDETINGFDLFTGIWWPLSQNSKRSPKRSVAWLIAKLYASCPLPHSQGKNLAYQLGLYQPKKDTEKIRFTQRFDRLLMLPLDKIEPSMRWALNVISSSNDKEVDWVKLTNDLSWWERQSKRLKWAELFLKAANKKENEDVN